MFINGGACMSEKRIIQMSFKESEKELYEKIKSYSSYSGWLKDAAKEKIAREQNQIMQRIPKTNSIQKNKPIFKDNFIM